MNEPNRVDRVATTPAARIHAGAPSSARWFPAWQRQPAPRLRLICFPYAGGHANAFATWAGDLGPTTEVRALQLPGRGARYSEKTVGDLDELLDAIEPHVPWLTESPYALFGHSLGGIVAFELARRLRQLGAPPPLHLYISSASIPERIGEVDPLHHLPDGEFVAQLRDLGGTPEEVFAHPDLMAVVLPALRSDFRMLERWETPAEPPLTVPMTVLGGRVDRRVPLGELAHWRRHAGGAFAARIFEGDHFYLGPARAAVTAVIRDSLVDSWFSLRDEAVSP